MEKPSVPARLDRPLTAEDRALFDRVWSRVMQDKSLSPIEPGGVQQPPADFSAVLETLGNSCLEGERAYMVLSRWVRGASRQRLLELSGAQRQQRMKIGAVFYLLTGRSFCPGQGAQGPAGTVTAALRQQFWREQAGQHTASHGAQLAREAGQDWLAGVFADSAEQARSHMEQLADILGTLSGR